MNFQDFSKEVVEANKIAYSSEAEHKMQRYQDQFLKQFLDHIKTYASYGLKTIRVNLYVLGKNMLFSSSSLKEDLQDNIDNRLVQYFYDFLKDYYFVDSNGAHYYEFVDGIRFERTEDKNVIVVNL